MLQYENEINNFIREIIFEDWMSEEDYVELLNELNKIYDIKELDNQIKIGISNGYPIETQFEIVKKLILK